jgi:hypothetical protein
MYPYRLKLLDLPNALDRTRRTQYERRKLDQFEAHELVLRQSGRTTVLELEMLKAFGIESNLGLKVWTIDAIESFV